MSGGGERTEAATPRKLLTLRQEGRVVKSTDLTSAVSLLAAIVVLQQFGGSIFGQLGSFMEQQLGNLARPDLTDAGLIDLGLTTLLAFVAIMAPIVIALPIVGTVANIGQSGLVLSGHGLKPDVNHINPLAGAKRLFSTRSVVELIKTVGKVAILLFILYRTYLDSLPALLALAGSDLKGAAVLLSQTIISLAMTVAAGFVALAVLDYAYQRWQFYRDARMTKDEVKQEMRTMELAPEIRAQIRRRQRKLAQARMMQNVPTADVVITNPTHFAVALVYRGNDMAAPKVVAKGVDLVAQRIREIAREHRVPIVENKPLAQALYKTVDLDHEIPLELFQAVAEVLAYIYGLRKKRVAGRESREVDPRES